MTERMTEIPVKRSCLVEAVEGRERLRFFELGFFRGSRVVPVYECAGGGTRVYLVKDTLIALRNGDAERILVKAVAEDA